MPDIALSYYAPEIETALVSILWHYPERLAAVLRKLDPALHFVAPHSRYVLEAISIAYGELNTADWASVVQVLRELGRLEDCGSLQGLNELYTAPAYEALIDWYVEILQEYAEQRGVDPHKPVFFFTGGQATLGLNKLKRAPAQPDYIGQAKIRGQPYSVSAWVLPDGSSINLKFEPA